MTAKDEQTVQWTTLIGFVVDTDADGIAQVIVGRVPSNVNWLVEGILFKTSAGPLPLAGTAFELFAAEPIPGSTAAPADTALRAFTTGFTEAEADYGSPRRFWPNEVVLARWSGFAAGFDASVWLQVRETQEIILPEPEIELPIEPEPSSTPEQHTWG